MFFSALPLGFRCKQAVPTGRVRYETQSISNANALMVYSTGSNFRRVLLSIYRKERDTTNRNYNTIYTYIDICDVHKFFITFRRSDTYKPEVVIKPLKEVEVEKTIIYRCDPCRMEETSYQSSGASTYMHIYHYMYACQLWTT